MLALILDFLLGAFLIRLGARAIEGALRKAMLGWANRLGGIIFYIFLYFLIYSIILFYATQLHLVKHQTLETSTTYPLIYPMAPVVMDALGSILPIFKNMFADLENFFAGFSKRTH